MSKKLDLMGFENLPENVEESFRTLFILPAVSVNPQLAKRVADVERTHGNFALYWRHAMLGCLLEQGNFFSHHRLIAHNITLPTRLRLLQEFAPVELLEHLNQDLSDPQELADQMSQAIYSWWTLILNGCDPHDIGLLSEFVFGTPDNGPGPGHTRHEFIAGFISRAYRSILDSQYRKAFMDAATVSKVGENSIPVIMPSKQLVEQFICDVAGDDSVKVCISTYHTELGVRKLSV